MQIRSITSSIPRNVLGLVAGLLRKWACLFGLGQGVFGTRNFIRKSDFGNTYNLPGLGLSTLTPLKMDISFICSKTENVWLVRRDQPIAYGKRQGSFNVPRVVSLAKDQHLRGSQPIETQKKHTSFGHHPFYFILSPPSQTDNPVSPHGICSSPLALYHHRRFLQNLLLPYPPVASSFLQGPIPYLPRKKSPTNHQA